jgi:hypothetical protein
MIDNKGSFFEDLNFASLVYQQDPARCRDHPETRTDPD